MAVLAGMLLQLHLLFGALPTASTPNNRFTSSNTASVVTTLVQAATPVLGLLLPLQWPMMASARHLQRPDGQDFQGQQAPHAVTVYGFIV